MLSDRLINFYVCVHTYTYHQNWIAITAVGCPYISKSFKQRDPIAFVS